MNIDLLIGLNAAKLNQCISNLFAKPHIYQAVFKGETSDTYENVRVTINWETQTAPVIEFREPAGLEWKNSIKTNGSSASPVENAFIIRLDAIKLSMIGGKNGDKNATIPLTIIGNASNNGNKAVLLADAVVIDISGLSPTDRFGARLFVPKILKAVNHLLEGLNIPVPSFPGVALTPARAGIIGDKLLIAFNLIEHAQPDFANAYLPDKSFFMLASPRLVQVAANYAATSNLQGAKFHQDDKTGGGMFSAEYSADAFVNNVSVGTTGNPLVYRANASLSMSAQAGINTPAGYIIDAIERAAREAAKAIEDAANSVIDKVNPSNW